MLMLQSVFQFCTTELLGLGRGRDSSRRAPGYLSSPSLLFKLSRAKENERAPDHVEFETEACRTLPMVSAREIKRL